ncbi:MAG: DUF362 domain-containing protein [Clostridiales bacterium]|nr:DUF362 domain-containing protein [Clostridiales bacterium]
MHKNEIIKMYGTEYKEMTKTLLAKANLAAQIPSPDTRIGIKPNLVSPTPADYGATTHPEVVAGIIEYLQEHGFDRIVVLEGAWVGDKTSEAFEYCGYRALEEQYGVELWDTQTDSFHEKDCAGMKLHICDMVDQIDFLINVPVLKGHCQTKITCALKNSKGLIPNSEKRRFHTMGLHKPIAHLGAGIHQDFIVTDHICGDLDFEEGGNPVVRNCVMAARDPVLMDAYVCRLLHYSVSDVPYVGMAQQLGVGSADLDSAQIITVGEEREEEITARKRVLAVEYAVEEVDSCSACYASLIPALDRLRTEGLLEKLEEKIAIGQGYRKKSGRLGVGLCTAGFDVCVRGCPPTEEQVYRELKQYILRNKTEKERERR